VVSTRSEMANLVFRLETAEVAGCEAQLRGLEAYDPRTHRYEIARIGRTILFSAPRLRRNSSYNRALAFSSSDNEHLDDILQWLRQRDACWFDVAPATEGSRAGMPGRTAETLHYGRSPGGL
jgi:hypothetical protein